jgi:hypothetical protein
MKRKPESLAAIVVDLFALVGLIGAAWVAVILFAAMADKL